MFNVGNIILEKLLDFESVNKIYYLNVIVMVSVKGRMYRIFIDCGCLFKVCYNNIFFMRWM